MADRLDIAAGERLEVVQDTPDVLTVEACYAPRGNRPPAHYHPGQDEHFEVLEGAVRAVVNGAERRYGAGEAFDIPARTPHQIAGAGPARLHWEVRPALRTAEFFERAYSDNPGEDLLATFADEFQLTAPRP